MTRPETLKLFPQSLNEFILIRVFGSQIINAHSNPGEEENHNQDIIIINIYRTVNTQINHADSITVLRWSVEDVVWPITIALPFLGHKEPTIVLWHTPRWCM